MVYRVKLIEGTWNELGVIRDSDGNELDDDARALIVRRLELFWEAWEWTPYVKGGATAGQAGDCVRFLGRLVDWLTGTPRPRGYHVRTLPQDVSLHNPAKARGAMKKIRRELGEAVEVHGPPYRLEPGDVLVTGPDTGGPGHVRVVSPRRNVVWNPSGRRIHAAGWSLSPREKIFHVYRSERRALWALESLAEKYDPLELTEAR